MTPLPRYGRLHQCTKQSRNKCYTASVRRLNLRSLQVIGEDLVCAGCRAVRWTSRKSLQDRAGQASWCWRGVIGSTFDGRASCRTRTRQNSGTPHRQAVEDVVVLCIQTGGLPHRHAALVLQDVPQGMLQHTLGAACADLRLRGIHAVQMCHSRTPNHTCLMAMLQMEVRPFRDSNYDLRRVEQDMAVQAVAVVQDTGIQATGGQVRGGNSAWSDAMYGWASQTAMPVQAARPLCAASSKPSCNGGQSGRCLAVCHKQTLLPRVVACIQDSI